MPGITRDLETIKHTVAVGPSSAYCMSCQQDYNGGATCTQCNTEVRFLALAYVPDSLDHKSTVKKFALDSGLPEIVRWIGYVTGDAEVREDSY